MRRVLLGFALACALTAFAAPGGEPATFLDKDLSNWQGLIKQYWSYKDGELVAGSAERVPFNTFLCSKRPYRDFELSFKVRLKDGKGNSGVQIRSTVVDREKFVVAGPQCDIGAGYWGSLYGERFDGTKVGKGGMMKAAPKEAQKSVKANDFNDYYIKAVGKKVTIKVNGITTVDDEFAGLPDEGTIAFQLHAGPPMQVTFKDIKFKELK